VARVVYPNTLQLFDFEGICAALEDESIKQTTLEITKWLVEDPEDARVRFLLVREHALLPEGLQQKASVQLMQQLGEGKFAFSTNERFEEVMQDGSMHFLFYQIECEPLQSDADTQRIKRASFLHVKAPESFNQQKLCAKLIQHGMIGCVTDDKDKKLGLMLSEN